MSTNQYFTVSWQIDTAYPSLDNIVKHAKNVGVESNLKHLVTATDSHSEGHVKACRHSDL